LSPQPKSDPRRLTVKTRFFILIVILTNVAGNALLSAGMRQSGALSPSPLAYIQVVFQPLVAAGVCLLILWMLSQMALLSWADLSYVLPVTAVGYLLLAVVSKYLLGESVSPARWAGIALITVGVVMVGRPPVNTREAK
jgi:drug/metabolite transporter (DMT)-like permease